MSYQKLNKATDETTGMIIDHGFGDYTDHNEVVQDSHRPKKRITAFFSIMVVFGLMAMIKSSNNGTTMNHNVATKMLSEEEEAYNNLIGLRTSTALDLNLSPVGDPCFNNKDCISQYCTITDYSSFPLHCAPSLPECHFTGSTTGSPPVYIHDWEKFCNGRNNYPSRCEYQIKQFPKVCVWNYECPSHSYPTNSDPYAPPKSFDDCTCNWTLFGTKRIDGACVSY